LLTPGVGTALSELYQAQQGPPSDSLLVRRQRGQCRVGASRYRDLQSRALADGHVPVRAAGHDHRFVGPEREVASLQPFPQQHQGLLDQRQRTRFADGIAHQALHQGTLHVDPDPLGRLDDGAAEAILVQR
jgi:hypothetical protein